MTAPRKTNRTPEINGSVVGIIVVEIGGRGYADVSLAAACDGDAGEGEAAVWWAGEDGGCVGEFV